MGRVTAIIKLTNFDDLVLRQHKMLKSVPRQMEVEVLVDTGATRIYLKPSVIKALGLRKTGHVVSRTTNGSRWRPVYSPIELELMGRTGAFEVVGVDENVPNLLGQIPLEYLDLVVDPKMRTLRFNPAHGGTQMTEEYCSRCEPLTAR